MVMMMMMMMMMMTTTLGEITDEMNPQHFGSDLADMQTRMRINPEIRIRIPDHFWLSLAGGLRSLSTV